MTERDFIAGYRFAVEHPPAERPTDDEILKLGFGAGLIEDVVCGAGSEWACPACGWLVDTPEHTYGCAVGRGEREPFVMDGTEGQSQCSICGSGLVVDDKRETGWRCPDESEHGKLPVDSTDFSDSMAAEFGDG